VKTKNELQKVLGYRAILLITINSIIGTGIFFLPALGAKHAGPASLISWLIMSVVAVYIGMCFGELTSMFPKAGGIYEFCKQAYGRFTSFVIGWLTILAGNITIAMLIVGAIQYILPAHFPLIKIAISLAFILLFNYIAYKGMKTSAVMLITFSFITLGTLVALIIPGLLGFNVGNFIPFAPFPFSNIFLTIFLIAETFFGWETATFLAAETKDGQKVMPKALVHATLIIAGICLLFVFTSLNSINWSVFGSLSVPLSALGQFHFGAIGEYVFTMLVYLAIIGSVAGWVVSAPRLILAMAEDKLFLSQFAAIHPVNKSPYKAIILQTILTTLLVIIGSGSYNMLLQLLIPLVLILYSFVLISLVVLRYKKPNLKRYYTVPFGKIGPIVIVVVLMSFIGFWLAESFGAHSAILLLGISLILIGIPLFFLLEMYHSSRTQIIVNNFFARLTYWTEDIFFPKKIRRSIHEYLGNVRNKKILETGCGVGTLTMYLAEHVKPGGQIYALNDAKHEIDILKERIEKEGHKHVKTIVVQKPHHVIKVPFADFAVSVGHIGNVEREEKLLKNLNKKLYKGSKLVFVDYDKFFDVIPNIEWLSKDEDIKRVFRAGGFSVKVIRKQGFAWQYIYIVGKKVRDL
jgi:basic amino acid/polyamine antiporter, APA family